MAGPTENPQVPHDYPPAPPYQEHPQPETQQPQPGQNNGPVSPAPVQQAQQPQQTPSQAPQQNFQNAYVMPLERLNDQPEEVDCPFCKRRGLTRVQKEDSSMTMVAGGLLCLFCICLTCLPCILGWAQNVDHYCGKCGKQLTHRPHDGTTMVVEAAKAARDQTGSPRNPAGPKHGQVPSQYHDPQSNAASQQEDGIQANPQPSVQVPNEKSG